MGRWAGTIRYSHAVPYAKHEGSWSDADTQRWFASGRPPLFVLAFPEEPLDSLDFLLQMEGLTHLSVIGRVADDSAVERLSGLQSLYLDTTCKKRLDLAPHAATLVTLSIDQRRLQRPDFATYASLTTYLGTWQDVSAESLARAPALRALRLHAGVGDLSPLADTARLEYISVVRSRRLTEIRALPSSLVKLEVDGCGQLRDISGVSDLPQLQIVDFENCPRLSTLEPLLSCPRLGAVSLMGSTTVADGRLSYLTGCAELAGIGVENARGFDMTRRDVDEFNASRPRPAPTYPLIGV